MTLESTFSINSRSYTSAFNINIINRILVAIREKGRVNRTNLAGMAGLNYNQCIKYVNLLRLLGWIDVVVDDSYQIVITEKGIEIIQRLNLQ